MPLSSDSQAELDTLLASLDLMTDDDAWFLADQWNQEDADARQRAWASAKAVIEKRGLTKELDGVRGSIGGWMASKGSDFQGIEGALLGSAASGAGARQSAAPALIDAAAALLAGDGLSDDDAGVLMRPWQAFGADEDEPAND